MTLCHSRLLTLCLLVAVVSFSSNCAPSEVAPRRPMDASPIEATADIPTSDGSRDGAVSDATLDAAPGTDAPLDAIAELPPGAVCGDAGACASGQRCDPTRMRCVDCLATTHCGGAAPVCASGRCVAATPCNSSRMCPGQVCDLNQSRCVDCVTDAECDTGQRCVDSVCGTAAVCRSSRDCSAAGLVCNVAQMRCVECLEDRDCAMGSTCTIGNVCRVAACAAGARRCVNMTRVAVCDTRGVMETESDCASGEVCTAGECRRLLCAPGTVSCESATARRSCNTDGMAYTVVACASGETCVAGECRAPGCMPGAATCTSATERRVCNPDGMTFASMTCPIGQMCSGGACAAAPTCPAGQTLCGAACIDLQRDTNHCGGCGRACAAGMVCGGGVCNVPTAPLAPMLAARVGHALVTLADGRVMAAGGHTGISQTLTAEIYDPVMNRWQSVAPMTSMFTMQHGVLLPDGRVAVSGRASTGTTAGSVEAYSPATNTWTRLPNSGGMDPFVVARVGGGYLDGVSLNYVGVRRFNLSTMMWSDLGTRFSTFRFNESSTVVPDAQGRIHLFGNFPTPEGMPPTGHVIVSLADGSWTAGPMLNGWRYLTAGVLGPDGLLYLSGGSNFVPGVSVDSGAEMRSFDPRTNTFRSLAPMPIARWGHRMTLLSGGRIFVAGGVQVLAGRHTYLNTTAIYTIATNTWR